jgi:hypothetical protein
MDITSGVEPSPHRCVATQNQVPAYPCHPSHPWFQLPIPGSVPWTMPRVSHRWGMLPNAGPTADAVGVGRARTQRRKPPACSLGDLGVSA